MFKIVLLGGKSFSSLKKIIVVKKTLYIVGIASFFVIIIGLIIGFVLYITDANTLFKENLFFKIAHRCLAFINDVFRSIPFIILLIILIPFTRLLVGTILGPKGAIPALVISASPFFARVVYNSLKAVNKDTLEVLGAMGASLPIKVKVIFKEALSSLVAGLTLTLVTLVGFMSAAAVIGAGGLAFLAFEYGKFGNNYPLMYLSVTTILLMVLIIQISGDYFAKKLDFTNKNKGEKNEKNLNTYNFIINYYTSFMPTKQL